MYEYDFLIVGGGYAALVCAGYLVKAGFRVGVLEQAATVGQPDEMDLQEGGSTHNLIQHTSVMHDLELTRYGLEYVDLDPLFFAPFPDGSHVFIWKDLDRTCDSIAQASPQDAQAYRRFVQRWQSFAAKLGQSFVVPPSPYELGQYLLTTSANDRFQWLSKMPAMMRSYGSVLRETFSSPQIQALIGWVVAQSGVPPSAPMSASLALSYPMLHEHGLKLPQGGFGMMKQALVRMIEDYGGHIRTNSSVHRILTRDKGVIGVETDEGARLSARAVVSSAHAPNTLSLLDVAIPTTTRPRLPHSVTARGSGVLVHYTMDELPDYTALPSPADGSPGPQHKAPQLICPPLDHLDGAYADSANGRPAPGLGLTLMPCSTGESSVAADGKHTMALWGQHNPHQHSPGAGEMAVQMLALLGQYAPNVKHAVIDKVFDAPTDQDPMVGLQHGSMTPLDRLVDQVLMRRPAHSMNGIRGPVANLYLIDAGTMHATGRNAASVILQDFSRRYWR